MGFWETAGGVPAQGVRSWLRAAPSRDNPRQFGCAATEVAEKQWLTQYTRGLQKKAVGAL